MTDQHAPLAPSAAPQWGHCSGSYVANLNAPDLDTPEKLEGTAAHWVASEVLTNIKTPGRGPVVCSDYLNTTAPNGVVINDKIAEGAQIYVDDVLETVGQYNALSETLVEHRVQATHIHAQHNWGTLDFALVLLSHRIIYIWDYKHGHRENTAVENFQLINYAEGLRELFQINGAADQHITVVLRIVQPFCYHAQGPISEWVVKLSDLRPYANILHNKAHEAFIDPKLTSGIWCRDCTAVGRCSAARLAGYNLIDVANRPYIMDEMTGADLATEREILKNGLAATKARLEAIEDELTSQLTDGRAKDSGLTLETSSGRLEWTVSPAEAIAFAKQFGTDPSKQEVLTPTQTQAAVPAKLRPFFKQILPTVTRRPAGKLKLVNAGESKTAQAFKPRSK